MTNKKRKLLDGSEVPTFDYDIILKVRTRCPEKWRLKDLETGEEYIGQSTNEPNSFDWKKVEWEIGKISINSITK